LKDNIKVGLEKKDSRAWLRTGKNGGYLNKMQELAV
jgi:hypothetical protein